MVPECRALLTRDILLCLVMVLLGLVVSLLIVLAVLALFFSHALIQSIINDNSLVDVLFEGV